MDLVIILNEKDDLVFKKTFPDYEDKMSYMDLIIVSFGSIDILNNMLKTTNSTYFGCFDTYKDYKISALIFPSAYKCIFLHKQTRNVKKFLYDVYYLIKHMIIYEIVDYDKEIEGINQNMINIYSKYYK
ncbi:trafficking protein particle complex subunit 2 (TRAPPC2) [Vairimorpha necatrix]|uniref:Trafficking protein particle complex subunit 2 (TRAPPC2) n=1 Tax=Vairimorpha necatrix TaxID=6039 RepID=A0AAX4JBX7_9MICR